MSSDPAEMGRAPAVGIGGLRVARGGRDVLRGLSFEIEPGSVVGLLGPSGCGKTTLMRAIVGVQIVAEGSVEVLGEPAGTPSLRRRVGYVTQAPSVYGDLSITENLNYFARVLGVPGPRVHEVLESVDLESHAHQVTANLSGGERARVSLATALLGEPELLVLDEPTVGLDPVLREALWQTFHQLAQGGTTLLISSHVMDEAGRCHQLLLMRDGRLLATESPQELRRRTGEEDLEAAFLALIRGEVDAGGGNGEP
jgi:ABC-2 type transport system ATP-binding protein